MYIVTYVYKCEVAYKIHKCDNINIFNGLSSTWHKTGVEE